MLNPLNRGQKSLSHRRGTRRSKTAMHPMFHNLLLLLLLICVAFSGMLAGMFFQMPPEEKQIHVARWRDKVQAVPNLLRGRKFPSNNTNPKRQKGVGPASPPNPGTSSGKNEYPYELNVVPDDYDVVSQYHPKGGNRFKEYTTGEVPYIISDPLKRKSDQVARSRRAFVKRAMEHAWKGYEQHAFGADEVMPQSGGVSQNWGGQGVTLVDSLDTLWLMDMKEEFWRARNWVRDHLDHSRTGTVSVFETTIRDLGGLLSAYDFSHDEVFLTKAFDLGKRLIKSFDNSDTGIPCGEVSLVHGSSKKRGWTGNNAILSEFGTLQIENRYLSKMTQQPEFARKTEHVFEILYEISPPNGLFPNVFKYNFHGKSMDIPRLRNGAPRPTFQNEKITFGAMGDSVYEYMLKVWLQGGKREPMYRDMYDKAIQGMHDSLLQTSTPSGLTYIADRYGGNLDHKMDHLVCFMGGLLALGAYTDPLGLQSARAQRDLKTGRALTYTCYQMYARMNTGMSPEFVQFEKGRDFVIGRGSPHYLLRPEAFESFFILNHLTGDPVYREWGWECFLSIEKYCKTKIAYGALSSVSDVNGMPRDSMESFFLAETLKYLYLLQDPDTEIDLLNRHVFNTEAHPLRIFPVIDQEEAA